MLPCFVCKVRLVSVFCGSIRLALIELTLRSETTGMRSERQRVVVGAWGPPIGIRRRSGGCEAS